MYITPVGTAVYPWLNNPDTRFDADGVYQVTLQLSKPELDDQGNATGNYLVKFKLKALVKPKKSEPFTQSPVLLDEDGNRLDALIAGGSKMKIAYEPFAYSAMGGGVSLRVKKVRMAKGGLIEYVAKDANLDWGDDCIDKPKKEEPVVEVAVLDDMSSPDLDDEDF